jgi:hypothetical protein
LENCGEDGMGVFTSVDKQLPHRLCNIRDESVMLNEQIEKMLDPPSLDILKKAISDKCTFVKNYKQDRHNKKLGRSNDSKHENIKKRWVINTSEQSLTQHEITIKTKLTKWLRTKTSIHALPINDEILHQKLN